MGGRPASGNGEIDGSTKLSDIDTAAEAEAACARASSAVDAEDVQALLEGSCTFAGLLAGFQGQNCEAIRAACLAEEPDPTSECSAQDFPDCDVTLDEYTACTSAQMNAFGALFEDFTCDSDISSIPQQELSTTPAACVRVFEACPELDSSPL